MYVSMYVCMYGWETNSVNAPRAVRGFEVGQQLQAGPLGRGEGGRPDQTRPTNQPPLCTPLETRQFHALGGGRPRWRKHFGKNKPRAHLQDMTEVGAPSPLVCEPWRLPLLPLLLLLLLLLHQRSLDTNCACRACASGELTALGSVGTG